MEGIYWIYIIFMILKKKVTVLPDFLTSEQKILKIKLDFFLVFVFHFGIPIESENVLFFNQNNTSLKRSQVLNQLYYTFQEWEELFFSHGAEGEIVLLFQCLLIPKHEPFLQTRPEVWTASCDGEQRELTPGFGPSQQHASEYELDLGEQFNKLYRAEKTGGLELKSHGENFALLWAT